MEDVDLGLVKCVDFLMSKNKTKTGERAGEVLGSEPGIPRMITSNATGLHTLRPSTLTTGPTYIVQAQHEMKNFSKSARPIAPAPPTQHVPNIAGRNMQSPQANIPSILSSSLAPGSNDNRVSLNLVTTTASSGLGTITNNPLAVPVTLSQTNVFQLGSNTGAGNLSVVQQGMPGPAVPITMLRAASSAGQQAQQHVQAFAQNFSHLRGASTPALPKPTGLLRQSGSATLQIPAGLNTLTLPNMRAPLLSSIKSTTPQVATRPQSPAVGGQPAPQTQPQDLSRTNFPMHGTIAPVIPSNMGSLSMQVPLNRLDNSSINQETIIHSRAVSVAQVSKDSPASIQQRISVSLSADPNSHTRLTPDLTRSTLPFSGPAKINHPSLIPNAKVVAAQPGTSLKSVSLAVTTPIMINSINPSLTTATTTVVSSTPIPIAKITPQRQLPLGSIPSQASFTHISSSVPLSASSVPLSISVPHTSLSAASLPPSSLATNLAEMGSVRQEVTGNSANQAHGGGIILSSDFQTRPPGSIISMTTLASSAPGSIITMTTLASTVQAGASSLVVSQAENRSTNQNQQQFDIKSSDPMWLQHFATQTLLVQQPAQIVRPGANTFTYLPTQSKMLAQTPNLAATQLAAMSVASSSNLRFNNGVMMVEQLRQHHQPHQVHSFPSGTTTVGSISEKTANLLSRGTVASSIFTSTGLQSQIPGGGAGGGGSGSNGVSGGPSSIPVSNPSSSPRPSILRKRTGEATGVVIRKPNFNLNQETRCLSPPRVDTNSVCSPKTSVKNFSPVSENSQSSTDTALSSNDATTPTHNHNEKGKGENDECLEHSPPASSMSAVNNIPASPAVSNTDSISEASPRKRARKQLLSCYVNGSGHTGKSDIEMEARGEERIQESRRRVSEQLPDNTSSSEDELGKNSHRIREDSVQDQTQAELEIRGEYTDEEGVRWVLNKPKPTYVLLQPDCMNNKTRNNHFTRYSDVKPKEERRPTVNELSNQRGIMQKVNGWKLYFSASQLEELMEVEKDMEDQFAAVQAALVQIPTSKVSIEETVKIHEMSQANIQRCQLIHTQLSDAMAAMIRTLEHKPRIQEIVNKHMSKRPIKKKERT